MKNKKQNKKIGEKGKGKDGSQNKTLSTQSMEYFTFLTTGSLDSSPQIENLCLFLCFLSKKAQ